MTTTVTGLFGHRDDALRAVEALRDAGIPDADISVVANNSDAGYTDERATDAAEDAGKGAGVGAVLGGAGAF